MIISSLVTKYRDFTYLIGFGVQLLMYLSAVVYPISLINQKIPEYAWIVAYNPLAYIVETTRFILLGVGEFSISGLFYTVFVAILLLFFGLLIFNKTEKSFIDTV
jgi:lipopolysaccharide transport system permease protein